MRVIHKHQFQINDEVQLVEMSRDAFLLEVEEQSGLPTLWFETDTVLDRLWRAFTIIGTGHPLPEGDAGDPPEYVGMAQCGPFVWHVYALGWHTGAVPAEPV